MSDDDGWLAEFAVSHTNLAHPLVFWLAVPGLITGYVGLLWSLPTPLQFDEISPLLNWGSAFLMVAAVYYFIISMPLAIGLLPFLFAVAALQLWASQSVTSQIELSLTLIVLGISGLWVGHRSRLDALLKDILHVMIAPAWLLSLVYRRFGIPL
ncbi:MAG: hypothetical protein AAF660_05205 [Pseudomonadota bacterium]